MSGRRTPPLLLLLCGLALFCGQVFAAAAVLGVDIGTEFIKTSLVKPGIPLEIVLTKDSRRKETSAVAFKPPRGGLKAGAYPERVYGSDAMALSARFPGDVYPNLKVLLGLPVDGSAVVAEYAARHPALKLEAHPVRKTSAFKSSGAFTAEEDAWLVEELLAMELQSVRRNAESMAGPETSVRSAVITVPPFYTTEEKRAVELAADLAGLRVLSLVSDGLAVGLNYATSRQFPNINEGGKPEINMVFDMGAGSTKATILKFQSRKVKDVGKFNKTVQEVQVLGSGWDRTLGGDTLNGLIVDAMIAQFVETPGAKAAAVTAESVKAHGRTIAKLSKEAERVRNVLSANTNTVASFEGLYEDIDFRYKISRAEFETMAESHAARVAVAVQQALTAAKLEASDLNSVILHGGATRTPFVQKQLEQIVGSAEKLRNNVNSDEAAVFGAGFRAAELSPSFRVKEIRVAEAAGYAAGMKWTNSKSQKLSHQKLWTPTSQLGAAPKEITLHQTDDFAIEFYQVIPAADGGEDTEAATKVLTTKNLTETVAVLGEKHACEPSTVQFKVSLQLNRENGEVDVLKVLAECEAEEPEKSIMDGVKNLFGFGKNKEQQPLKEGEEASTESSTSSETASSETASSETSSSTATSAASEASSSTETTSSTSSSATSSSTASASASASSASTVSKKVIVSIPVKYSLDKAGIPQLSKPAAQKLKDRLRAFESSDRARFLREETLNQLEAFTYRVRSLLESEEFIAVSTAEERATLEKLSLEASDWLYGEGADASYEELKAKHAALKDLADPVEARITEHAKRPELVASLKEALEQSRTFAKTVRGHIDEYEQFQAAKSASASASTAAASETPAAAATPEGEFAGLEDDAEPVAEAAEAAEEDAGPPQPLYSVKDLEETDKVYDAITAWLAEKEEAQAKLSTQENPVLTVKELEAKLEEIKKAALDLAMKAMHTMDPKKGKGSKSKSTKSTKSKTASKAKASSKSSKASKSAKTSSATSETGSSNTSAEPIPTASDENVKHEEL